MISFKQLRWLGKAAKTAKATKNEAVALLHGTNIGHLHPTRSSQKLLGAGGAWYHGTNSLKPFKAFKKGTVYTTRDVGALRFYADEGWKGLRGYPRILKVETPAGNVKNIDPHIEAEARSALQERMDAFGVGGKRLSGWAALGVFPKRGRGKFGGHFSLSESVAKHAAAAKAEGHSYVQFMHDPHFHQPEPYLVNVATDASKLKIHRNLRQKAAEYAATTGMTGTRVGSVALGVATGRANYKMAQKQQDPNYHAPVDQWLMKRSPRFAKFEANVKKQHLAQGKANPKRKKFANVLGSVGVGLWAAGVPMVGLGGLAKYRVRGLRLPV